MTILVAGGAGFLGSAVAEALLGAGTHVVVADAFTDAGDGRAVKEERAERIARHPWARVARGDLADPRVLEPLFLGERPEAVVNAAVFDDGGAALARLLAAAREARAGHFVHLSDAALYGPAPGPGRHASEDEPIAPDGDADLLTRAAEERAVLASGLDAVVLRVFDVLAPGAPPGRFPAEALEAVLAGEAPPPLLAEPRDHLHARDVARAVLLALEKRPSGATINVGSGIGTTPRAVVERLARLAGVPVPELVTRAGTRAPRIADVERAFTTLGFAPTHELDAILAEIVESRFQSAAAAPAARTGAGAEAPRHPRDRTRAAGREPEPVTRRELFGFLRRPRE